MPRANRSLLVAAAALVLTGCGTTSDIRTSVSAEPTAAPYDRFDAYRHVAVLDFADGVDKTKFREEYLPEYEAELTVALKLFPELIASELRKTEVFQSVSRSIVHDDSMVISETVTRYIEGNAVLRFFIGLGAGSSYFDAEVNIADNQTGEQLGEVLVDKNSWGFGGGIAAGQNVKGFMRGAARKTAHLLAGLEEPVSEPESTQ